MKKIVSLLLVGCLSVSMLVGCKKEEVSTPTIGVDNVISTDNQENIAEQVPIETLPLELGDTDKVNVLFQGNPEVIELVEAAYNNMAAMKVVKGHSVHTYMNESVNESILIWDNETSNLKTIVEYDCAEEAEEHTEDDSCGTRVVQYLICDEGVYTEYTVTESLEDGSLISVDKSYYTGDSSDNFKELFTGLFSASLQEEPVDWEGRPHYHLKANPEWFGTYDAYIDCETLTLSRLFASSESLEMLIDFEESDEMVAVPDEVVEATKDIALGDKPEPQSYCILPPLGSPELKNMNSFNVGGVDIAIGQLMGSVLNAQFDGWHCELDAYYDTQGYITDDGGKVPVGAYATYVLECDDDEYTGIIMVYAVNNTNEEIDPEDCVIACFGMLYATEYVYGYPVTMLDMCVAQGGNYSFVESFVGTLGTWDCDGYDIYVSYDYDELAIIYVVNEELFGQFYPN